MSMIGTLAKLALGYAAARGVDRMSGGQGLAGLFGGPQVAPGKAHAAPAPGMGELREMMAKMQSGGGFDMGEMMRKFTGPGGFDLSALMGGTGGGSKGGLLSSGAGGADSGLAGLLAMMGGAASMGAKGTGAMLDQMVTRDTAPQMEEAAGLMLRAMIQAAKADGEIDKAEEAKILEAVGDDADAGDIAFLKAQLAAPVDPEALAAEVPAPMAMQVYSISLMPIRVDTEAEAAYLDKLAGGLGLNQETVNALHLQMGVKPLYG